MRRAARAGGGGGEGSAARTAGAYAEPPVLRPGRRVGWGPLAVAPAAVVLLTLVALGPLLAPARAAARATGGLVQPTLLFNLLNLAVVLGGVIVAWGGLRLRDVGLRWDRLAAGAAVTAGAWLFVQAASVVWDLAAGRPPLLHPGWSDPGVTTLAGLLLGQLLGNALAEETVWRGFLVPQLYGKLRRRANGAGGPSPPLDGRALAAALLLSQAAFALMHVPVRLRSGVTGAALALSLTQTLALGLFFAALWLRTGNLFVAVGIHALGNYPTPLLQPAFPPDAGVLFYGVLVAWAWPRLAGRARRASRR